MEHIYIILYIGGFIGGFICIYIKYDMISYNLFTSSSSVTIEHKCTIPNNNKTHTSFYCTGPQMLHCISQNFTPAEFEGHDDTPKSEMEKTHVDRKRYYEKLGGAKFGVCLPGLGYDTFRMWELLTMGTVVIIERAVGYDRTVSVDVCLMLILKYYIFDR